MQERTELRPAICGIIDAIYYKVGDTIPPNAVLLKLSDNISIETDASKLIAKYYTNCIWWLCLKELDEDELKDISEVFDYRDFSAVAECTFTSSMAIGAGDVTNLLKKESDLF